MGVLVRGLDGPASVRYVVYDGLYDVAGRNPGKFIQIP